jgi:hypothetical protein
LRDKDPTKSARVMAAMMKMQKLDIAGLKRAYAEKSQDLSERGTTARPRQAT